MTDRRLALVIAVVVVLILGTLVYRHYLPGDETKIVPATISEEDTGEKRRTRVYAELTECRKSGGGKTQAKGFIENTGNVDLNYVTVKVIWSNYEGLVIEENELYALSNHSLAPGETKSFTDVTEKTTAEQCNVKPVDWW